MKVKVNTEKQTISIKGLSIEHYSLIRQLLWQVRLGDDTPASDAAYELIELFDGADEALELEPLDVTIGATTSEEVDGLDLWIMDPMLVVHFDNVDEYGLRFDGLS
jgi:hypothetical protein